MKYDVVVTFVNGDLRSFKSAMSVLLDPFLGPLVPRLIPRFAAPKGRAVRKRQSGSQLLYA